MVEENSLQPADVSGQLGNVEVQEKRRVSLLRQVREGLQADQRVYCAGEISHPSYGGGWVEMVDVIVAPVEPTYDPRELNQFMDSLVPDIPRSARDGASRHDNESNFHLGRLYFDETLGETTREILITTTAVEPEALKRAGVSVGKSRRAEKGSHDRRTSVRVYPDVNSARIVAEYERGLADGTVVPNETFGQMERWLTPEQFSQMRGREKPLIKLPKLIRGR